MDKIEKGGVVAIHLAISGLEQLLAEACAEDYESLETLKKIGRTAKIGLMARAEYCKA